MSKSVDKIRKKDDLFNSSSGAYSFCIRGIPDNRICQIECRDYKMIIEEKHLYLTCLTLLNKPRKWVYTLEEEFTLGRLVVSMDIKSFNLLMLKLKSSMILNIVSQTRIDIHGKMKIKIKSYRLERGY